MNPLQFSAKNISFAVTIVLFLVLVMTVWKVLANEPSVAFLSAGDFYHPSDSSYKHYQQPVPGHVINMKPPEWLSYHPVYTINSDGLNERYDYQKQIQRDTYRIVTLGDSWTYGMFVDTKDNYSEVLEDMLNDKLSCPSWKSFEVINLGVPSHDIQYSVERYRLKGQAYNPHLLVWFFIANDFDESAEYMGDYRHAHANGIGDLSANRMEKNEALRIYEEGREAFVEEYGQENIVKMQEEALAKIHDHFSRELLLVTMPDGSGIDEVYKPILKRADDNSTSVRWFDSQLPLREEGRSLPDQHPSALGHAAIAENLFHYILATYLPECQVVDF